MQLPQLVEVKGIRVLTTKQLAELYGTDTRTLQYNFRYNKERYILGKHYIEVNGDELRRLKTRSEIPSSFKYAKSLYLWTEKGALLHAKSLNTDKAWEVYDYLVDFYFRAKEKAVEPEKKEKAKEYKHMTFLEAADMAKRAQVKQMWLTHYSPSLIRPEDYMDGVRKIFPQATAGKDGKSIDLLFEEEQ